jgi:hypothetical protein
MIESVIVIRVMNVTVHNVVNARAADVNLNALHTNIQKERKENTE